MMRQRAPIRRLVTPQEIGAYAGFLCRPGARSPARSCPSTAAPPSTEGASL